MKPSDSSPYFRAMKIPSAHESYFFHSHCIIPISTRIPSINRRVLKSDSLALVMKELEIPLIMLAMSALWRRSQASFDSAQFIVPTPASRILATVSKCSRMVAAGTSAIPSSTSSLSNIKLHFGRSSGGQPPLKISRRRRSCGAVSSSYAVASSDDFSVACGGDCWSDSSGPGPGGS